MYQMHLTLSLSRAYWGHLTYTRTPGTLPSMDTTPSSKTLTVAPEWDTNKWPSKLTRTVMCAAGIINTHDLLAKGEPAIGWTPQGTGRDMTVAGWRLWVKGYKFPDVAWYDYGALSFVPMRGGPEDKQAKLLEAIHKADALGLCAPHQWTRTPWGDWVPVAACRRAWDRAFPGKVFPLDNAKVVKGE
jgi:hypothetical protein